MKAHKSRDLRISDNCLTWYNFSLIVFLLKQHGKRYVWVASRLKFLGMTSASADDWRFRNHYFNHHFNHCRVCERYRYLSFISVSIFRAEIGLLTFPVYKRHQSLISVSIWSDRKVERLFTKILFSQSCCKGSSRIIIILRQSIQIGIWIGAAMEEAIWKGQSTGVWEKKRNCFTHWREQRSVGSYKLRLRLPFPLAKYPMLTLPFIYSEKFYPS